MLKLSKTSEHIKTVKDTRSVTVFSGRIVVPHLAETTEWICQSRFFLPQNINKQNSILNEISLGFREKASKRVTN